MLILPTAVIPIEYDEKTKNDAIKLKKQLEENPTFFKAVLKKYNSISYQKKKNALYIPNNELITIIEKMYDGTVEKYNKKDWLEDGIGQFLLLYIINQDIKGKYDFSEYSKEYVNQFIVYSYIHEKKDYNKLYSYLKDPTESQYQKTRKWLQDKYQFELLNYLVKQQYQKIETRLIEEDMNIEDTLATMIKITAEEYCDKDTLEESCTFYIPKEKTYALCKEFLIQIDGTLSLYQKFCEALNTKKIIEDQEDLKIIENEIEKDDWCCFCHKDGNYYIYAPRTNTILDSIYIIHEFIHYVINIQSKDREEGYQLKELCSLFFEALMEEYIIEKNYPKEIVMKERENRNLHVAKMADSLLNILFFLIKVGEDKKITLKEEVKEQQEIQEDYEKLYPEEKCKVEELEEIVLENCKATIEELIEDPLFVENTYPYIIGHYYSKILLERAKSDTTIIPCMIDMTTQIKSFTTNQTLKKLGLIPQKEESNRKQKSKKS